MVRKHGMQAAALAIGFALSGVWTASAFAQEAARATNAEAPRENLMKACGDKWRGVREAEAAQGVTWPQYLAKCRAEAAASAASSATRTAQGGDRAAAPAQEASTSAPSARTVPAAPAPDSAQRAARPSVASAAPVFPDDVAARHASERPALARQRTCADQFKANKANQGNGGLRWIEKGGGYWSRCNAHLKQLRA